MEALAFKQFDGANRNTSKKRKAENASRDTSIRNLLIELLNRDVAMMVYNSMRTEFPPIALSHIYNCWQQISDQLFLGKVPVVVIMSLCHIHFQFQKSMCLFFCLDRLTCNCNARGSTGEFTMSKLVHNRPQTKCKSFDSFRKRAGF